MNTIDWEAGRIHPLGAGKALAFAWLVEAIAVAMGLTLAIFAGIEGSDGGVITIAVAMLPFVALSVIELTKIPLVGLAFRVRRLPWHLLAVVALLCVTAATFENFVFGFERGFNERIRAVRTAEAAVRDLQSAEAVARSRIPDLSARQADVEAQLAALRQEMAASRTQAEADIANAKGLDESAALREERQHQEERLKSFDEQRDKAVAAENARCQKPGVRDCQRAAIAARYARQREAITRRIDEIDQRRHSEHEATAADERTARQRRDRDLAGEARTAGVLQEELDGLRRQMSEAQLVVLHSSQSVAEAARTRDVLIERSQLHRLSDIAFGNHEPAALEATKRFFVVSLAAIVAVIGTVVATMHYAALAAAMPGRRPLRNAIRGWLARRRRRIPLGRDIQAAARQRQRLARALRAYLARRRRRVVSTIIKEVPVDRLKIVFLPLDATEEQVAAARREATMSAA
jgi:hypothetical protein